MRNELWVEIPGISDYEVSSHGRMKRVTPGRGTRVGRIFIGAIRNDQYRQVFCIPGLSLMHQVVALAFFGPCPVGREVNHKDRVRSHNYAWNLEYVTRSGNAKHWIHFDDETLKSVQEKARRHLIKAQENNKSSNYKRQREARYRNAIKLRESGFKRPWRPGWWVGLGFKSIKEAIISRGLK